MYIQSVNIFIKYFLETSILELKYEKNLVYKNIIKLN